MTKFSRLQTISEFSRKNKEWVHKDIFRLLNKDEIWTIAYKNVKEHGTKIKTEPHIIDSLSTVTLTNLKEQVCTETYKFGTRKVISIMRFSSKEDLSAKLVTADKVVQEVMRMILEAVYEPIFLECNFGFRSKLGAHDALNYVETYFKGFDWIIGEDTQQKCSRIDYHSLVQFLKKRIDDSRFLRLIWKFLNCELLEQELFLWAKFGNPRQNLVSLTLVNVYYHELDEFVKELFIYLITLKKRFEFISSTGNVSSMKYLRCGNEWMIGTNGTREGIELIKIQVGHFKKKIFKELTPSSTMKVANLRIGNVQFLGYDIFLPRNQLALRRKGGKTNITHRIKSQLRFDIPVKKITQRCIDLGYIKQLKNKIRPISKASYSVLEDHIIVSHYHKLWSGIDKYYSGCTNRKRLQYIHHLLHMSCAMTLGHRHRKTCSRIFKERGQSLLTKLPNTNKSVSFSFNTNLRSSNKKWHLGEDLRNPLLF